VGLFEIGTLPSRRRRGLATAVVERLLAWGERQGARAAYLQVMGVNAPARALYARLGFTEAYRYWYRVGG
jgi:ribosomal protein S18 acetylase RimI-like enzyme